VADLAAKLMPLVSEYDEKWSALDVAGVADLWERDTRMGSRLKCASVSSQLWSADVLAGGLARCILLSRWSFTGLESDIAHTGVSWITWLLTPHGNSYHIFHHMESQVYLEDGFRHAPLLGPDDEPAR
jgi:hypothetical protein